MSIVDDIREARDTISFRGGTAKMIRLGDSEYEELVKVVCAMVPVPATPEYVNVAKFEGIPIEHVKVVSCFIILEAAA